MRLRSQPTSESPAKPATTTRFTRRRALQKENIPSPIKQSSKPVKGAPARKGVANRRRRIKTPEAVAEPDSESEVEVESVLSPAEAEASAVVDMPAPTDEALIPTAETSLPPSSNVPKSLSSSTREPSPVISYPQQAPSSPWAGPKFDISQSELGDYADEPSRQPDPTDPFGFLAAERQLKLRREAFREERSAGAGDLSFEEEAAISAALQIQFDEEEEEDAPRAFATPQKARASRIRRSTRNSSPRSPVQPDSSGHTILEATPRRPESPRLTTMELEELLPKRRPVKKFPKLGQRANAQSERKTRGRGKADALKGNQSEDEGAGKPVRRSGRPRRAAKKEPAESDGECEEIDIYANEKNLKV